MALLLFPPDSPSLTPPGGGVGGSGERAEGDRGDQPLIQELWFIVLMAGIALLLLAFVLGLLLHKVRDITWLFYVTYVRMSSQP